ncbi:hypothetical protein [Streptomyces virginiae]|uniref:hypothetical protein n=1 Tax=Streptomyces virginiae TaxID=1961 RepID=UPI00368396BC
MTEQPEPSAPAEQPVCCGCNGAHGPVVYHNHREQPFCAHCCECSCGTHPCTAPQPEQPARHTADTVNDKALDELYARAEQAETAAAQQLDRGDRLSNALHDTIDHLKTSSQQDAATALIIDRAIRAQRWSEPSWWCPDCGGSVPYHARHEHLTADAEKRAKQAEAAIARVRELHAKLNDGSCADCCAPDCENNYRDWPCDTIRALDDPKEPTP